MSSPAAQKITVRHEGTDRVFDATQHITMGRAPEVTLFVDSPLVSRVHATLAWQGNAWVLSDNGSTNGVFVEARRLSRPVPIDRPTLVRLGDAITGPLLHLLPDAARPNQPAPHRPAPPQRNPNPPQSRPHTPPNSRPQAPLQPPPPSRPPQRPAPQPMPNFNMTAKADSSALPPMRARASTAPIARADRIPSGGLTIGRTSDNQIVVNDPLASRRHARLVKSGEGLVIEDVGSANGTFVNGRREQRTALRERDIVTIGNVDFVVSDGALIHRKKPVAEQGLHVHGVGFAVEGNKQLLVDVNLAAGRGTLTALIGPSGAGKSTLSKLIAGTTHPSAGVVTFEGRNLHAEYEAMRSRIGMVPQDDVLHRQLTVRQALGFAAELRLPPDSTKADRQQVIDGVLKELSLTEHADTRVDRLSGGQRKRASVALELLTGPALLLLDEPTSGLDPALDRQVMTMLRELADAGRTVIVVTHSVACLDMCDQVLLLAPGGKTAFCGHPAAVGHFLGTSDWAEIFARVAADPDRAFANYRSRQAAAVPPPPPAAQRGVAGQPPKSSGWKQFSTLSRRQVRLILADRGYLAFLVVLPFVLGVLSLVVPGKNGFAPGPLVPLPDGSMVPSGGGETQQLLVVLILGACFMGSTLTVRDLVGERPIFYRERAVGLLPSAYLMAKVMVFGTAALLQSAVLVGIVLAGKNPPGKGTLVPSGSLELYFDLAFTAVTCVVIGLLLSTLAKSNEQVMPLLVVMIMCQLVMAGGMIPVTDRVVLEQLSYLFPSRWGFAAGASTVDLRGLFAGAQPDALWQHKTVFWLLDIAMLLVLTAILSTLTWWRLRLKKSTS
ncbi:FHA domain-containing protein [Nocardia pseudobrasiliensis]|uniref:FHA modulated ABC efflux pump with fused ATPase and integral membrane subunit n=1 Tax=Nocardia pseudobrasiliensis TaxID=45979 RepID=A0A370I1L3_9NOCA|nr:FHA domain-containing protein [Nocardia pseudobrasiliensis]RDI64460.1 FHA modulated ABC efflux pump with fused ATPase and integral membrane subunit [Nocardia pseudobrasiliensis]